MKVLVTGASGFIGKHVVNALVTIKDMKVIASASSDESLKVFKDKAVETIPFDYYHQHFDNVDLFKMLGAPDKMIHLAWKGLPNYGETFHVTENLPKEFKFIENLLKNGLNDITVSGTCFEY